VVSQLPTKVNKANRRIKLANRFGWKCHWCSQMMREELGYKNSATIEHLQPRSQGGPNSLNNLASACERCNRARGVMPAEEFALMAREFGPDTRCIQEMLAEAKEQRRQAHARMLVQHAEHRQRKQADMAAAMVAAKTGCTDHIQPGSRAERIYLKHARWRARFHPAPTLWQRFGSWLVQHFSWVGENAHMAVG
jgi:GNAT superfamily N-acetyltransferase